MFQMPMSSPMITTMFGFGCAEADAAVSAVTVNSATRISKRLRVSFIASPLLPFSQLLPDGAGVAARRSTTPITAAAGRYSGNPRPVSHPTLVLPRVFGGADAHPRTLGKVENL